MNAGLRIRIHFIRIRIQHFRLNIDPDPAPIRIRIQSGSRALTQQVLNGQIGSPKSLEFQEFFSQGKQRLRTLIFF
jgi:hypothetical protein